MSDQRPAPTEFGAIFRGRDEGRQATERADARIERDPLASAYASFRRRARGEDAPPPQPREGDSE